MEPKDVKSTVKIQAKITLEITEVEAHALHTITTYGEKAFLDAFYTVLGKSYLKPYENGIVSLFATLKEELPKHLEVIKDAREYLNTRPQE